MSVTSQTSVFVDQLQAGDVLLMMGDSEISRAIAWCSNSEYSHAAIVADQGMLLEAAPGGAHLSPIEKSVRAIGVHYLHIRAFRPQYGAGQPMSPTDQKFVLRKIRSLVKTPYPLGDMLTLGAAVVARGKLIENERLKTFVAMLIGCLIPETTGAMSCAELVYRCLAQNEALPERRLAPVILIPELKPDPVWEVDLHKLFEEFCKVAATDPAIWERVKWFCKDFKNEPNAAPVTDEEYNRLLGEFRAKLGLDETADAALPDPRPNPRLIQPEDFAASPSCVLLGDVKVRGD